MKPPSELNPFPWYAQMRQESPVFHDVEHNIWHVFGYDNVQRVLSDYEVFSSQRSGGNADPSKPLSASIISLDPPRHRQLRTLATQAFTPRTVAQLAPRITAITHELLDRVAGQESFDVMEDLAYPLPVIVIAELLGIPAHDRERFKLWSDAIVQGGSAAEKAAATLGADWHRQLIGYFQQLIAERAQAPQDDLISGLIAAQVDGESLSPQELIGFCILLLVAGNETTTNLIGNAIWCMDDFPSIETQLAQEPDLIPAALEEVLRYRSPVQSMFRITKTAVELSGQMIPAQQPILAWIGSANRDAAQFSEPDDFVALRNPNRHLGFGYGIHFCLGAPLARLEGRIALQAILERIHTIRRVPGVELTPLEGKIVYGVKHLPVSFINR